MIQSLTIEEIDSRFPKSLLTCDNCAIKVDSSQVTDRVLDRHKNKECLSKLICMFCFELFDKIDQETFETHVRSHISLSIMDT